MENGLAFSARGDSTSSGAHLVEVRLQVVHALALLQQPRPVLLLQLLLPQLEVHVRAGVVRLGGVDVDVAVELELDVVGGLLGLGVAAEGEAAGLEVDLGLGDVGRGDREGDVVVLGVRGGGALGPDD